MAMHIPRALRWKHFSDRRDRDSTRRTPDTSSTPPKTARRQRPLAKAVKPAYAHDLYHQDATSLTLHHPHSETTDLLSAVTDTLQRMRMSQGFYALVPSRIGHCTAVDSAAAAMVLGCQGRSSHAHAATDRSYMKAISRLRAALVRPEQHAPHGDNLLLAAAMLASFNLVHGSDGAQYSLHARGISALLLTYGADRGPSELARGVLWWHWPGMFQIPVARGEASPFDTPVWLDQDVGTTIHAAPDVNKLSSIGNTLLIRLPRLIALVRSLRLNPTDPALLQQGIALSTEMQQMKDLTAENNLLHLVRLVKTATAADARIVPISFDFDRPAVFLGAAKYWQTVLLLNRLCLALAALTPAPHLAPNSNPHPSPCPSQIPFNTPALRAENHRITTNLLMSWQYHYPIGWVGLWALRVGFLAAWATTLDAFRRDPDAEWRAGLAVRDVRVWLLRRYSDSQRGRATFTAGEMDEAADVLVGGPLTGFFVEAARPGAAGRLGKGEG
ncbi:hypothetical protein LTR53_010165 [Teratosphaeriaceae sp. CCFEE 6253]|nr:hypothetical protein LTR53_010165 [Teratosphaeriaceae sp. CCFEE 6253]